MLSEKSKSYMELAAEAKLAGTRPFKVIKLATSEFEIKLLIKDAKGQVWFTFEECIDDADLRVMERKAELITRMLNVTPEMGELAAISHDHRANYEDMRTALVEYLMSLEYTRSYGPSTGMNSDIMNKHWINLNRQEDILRRLIAI